MDEIVDLPLRGRRVMVVEDELLVAMLVEDVLTEQGCHILGPYMKIADALTTAREGAIDLAVLDVNLRGEWVYPVAEALASRGIPFVLLSGYGSAAIPAAHPEWLACSKPFHAADLIQALIKAIAAVPSGL